MQFETFLEGNTVDLVIINHDLITNHSWHTWLNDQKLTKYTNQGYFPITEEENYQYFKDNILSIKSKDNNFEGDIDLKPFYLSLNIDVNEFDIKKFLKND